MHGSDLTDITSRLHAQAAPDGPDLLWMSSVGGGSAMGKTMSKVDPDDKSRSSSPSNADAIEACNGLRSGD